MTWDIRDPNYRARVERIFDKAPFLKNLGLKFADCGPGWCEAFLEIQNYHKQQDRVVHAGVLGTLADHSAGGAAGTLISADEIILTVEYKINLLRAAKGEMLSSRAELLKAGERFSIAESSVFMHNGPEKKLVAKAMVTLAVLPKISEE